MKYILSGLFVIITTSASAGESKKFEYPTEISCKPRTQLTVDIVDGIKKVKDKEMIEDHVFEYLANGKYRFKRTSKKDILTTFDTGLSNQESVLNIYSNSIKYSIALYANRYVMLGNMSFGSPGDSGVYSIIIEGPCEIKW